MRAAPYHQPASLADLGALVTVYYPDRPDLAVVAALRLLAMAGGAPEVSVVFASGALLTRRVLHSLRSPTVPANVAEARRISDDAGGGLLLIGTPEPVVLLRSGPVVMDLATTYRLDDLGLPSKLLLGRTDTSRMQPGHAVVDFPYGLTGVYAYQRTESALSAAIKLRSQLGPLTKRRIDYDVQLLEPTWRQLRDCA